MNQIILFHVTREISRGRPLAAILLANEHLPPADPLRRALVTKAVAATQGQYSRYRPIRTALRKILQGSRFQELSFDESTAVRGFRENEQRLVSDRYLPKPVLMQTRQGSIQRQRRVWRQS